MTAAVTAGASAPVFVDVAGPAGVLYLQHVPKGPPNCLFEGLPGGGSFCEPERMTGGVAVGDADGDGAPDLFVTRLDAPDLLFRNRRDGTFEDVTRAAGLAGFDLQSNGAAFVDIDKDGDEDLYVTTLGESGDEANTRNYLFVNQGDGVFVEEAVQRGAAVDNPTAHRTYSVAVGDYDVDGWPDLHVTEWLPSFPSNARLLRNRGAAAPGHFEDVTQSAGVDLGSSYSFASAFSDLDADGWPDLVVAGDFGTSRLFWNDGDGTFTDGTVASGVGTDENGMGSTLGDYDGDGDLDWFVTSIWDPQRTCEFHTCNWGYSGNRLFRNEGGRRFSDATGSAGVRKGYWGWGAAFFDYDNDGDLDVVMTNGVDFPTTDIDYPFTIDPMRLWRNEGDGGRMTAVAAASGLTDQRSGKGLAVFDYDGDGDLDVVTANNAGPPRLYSNEGGEGSDWLRVRTLGTTSTRAGAGARVALLAAPGAAPQVRETGSATHFLGQSERVAHFGLGAASPPVHRVVVRWPGGVRQTVGPVPPRTTLLFVEGVGVCALEPFQPPPDPSRQALDADADGVCDRVD